MQNDQAIAGLVVGLDYKNPLLDPHQEFQRFKTHPAIAPLFAEGKMTFYGAKAIPEGGWWSMPRLSGDGFLLVGDSAGMLNSQRLKGVHLGMKSGMLAAETIFDALKAGGATAERLAAYQGKVDASWIKEELWEVRNFHQAFDHGVLAGMLQAGVGLVTGGRGWGFLDRLPTKAGHERMIPLDTPAGRQLRPAEPVKIDGKLTFDRLADVYNSGTAHDEDQPAATLVGVDVDRGVRPALDDDVAAARLGLDPLRPGERALHRHVARAGLRRQVLDLHRQHLDAAGAGVRDQPGGLAILHR